MGQWKFLGTGGSLGIPVIGCECRVCRSQNPKDKRGRSGALLELGGKRFVVDASPDFRSQALREGIDAIDGFILTHSHYDHMGGFEDLKPYTFKRGKIPCMLLKSTLAELRSFYFYLIPEDPDKSTLFSWHVLDGTADRICFEGVEMEYVTFMQGPMQVMGLRIGSFAYISDIKQYTPELMERLNGVETLVLSAPREVASAMHFSVEDALDFAKRIGPKTLYLTHIAHEVGADRLLPQGVFFAYDGLTITF